MTSPPMDTGSQDLLASGLVQDPGAIPLVIGVAGHRDPRPQDLPRLRQRCHELLSELLTTLPNTPLLMLNGLAAGMDSEAAEIFLELVAEQRQQRPVGPHHQLVAALPKPRQLYLDEDFPLTGDVAASRDRKAKDRARLERLLGSCDAVLDGDNCVDLTLPPSAPGEQRDPYDPRCYGRQGIFLVRHCYLLLAFSNSLDSGKLGGTTQTVAMQQGQLYPLFVQVDEVIAAREPGVVVEVTTPRESDLERPCPVADVRYWGENLDGGRVDAKDMACLERSKLQQLLAWPAIPMRLEQINRALHRFPPVTKDGSGPETSVWLYADELACNKKKVYERLCRFVMAASVLIGLSISQQNWQAIGLLIVLAAVVAFPKLQRGPKLAFIQWRCLAESLLVTDLWAAAGVTCDTADLFHSQTNQNFAWIRTLLRARRLQLMALQTIPEMKAPLPEVCDRARDWINGQANWLGKAITTHNRLDQTLLRLGGTSFLLALAFAAAYRFGMTTIPQLIPDVLIGLTGALIGYRELMGYADTIARYGRSQAQFIRAAKALSCARPDPHTPGMLNVRRQLVLEAVGREKIDELNDWVGDQLQRQYSPTG